MSVKLLSEHNLEFLRLKEGCTFSLESTLVKIPHCWKSRVGAHFTLTKRFSTHFNGNLSRNWTKKLQLFKKLKSEF